MTISVIFTNSSSLNRTVCQALQFTHFCLKIWTNKKYGKETSCYQIIPAIRIVIPVMMKYFKHENVYGRNDWNILMMTGTLIRNKNECWECLSSGNNRKNKPVDYNYWRSLISKKWGRNISSINFSLKRQFVILGFSKFFLGYSF